MSMKSFKIQVRVPRLDSIESTILLEDIKTSVSVQLSQRNMTVSETVLVKSCKNALSLARSQRKNAGKFLNVYISQNSIDSHSSCTSNSVPYVGIENEKNSTNENFLFQNNNQQPHSQLKFDFLGEKGLMIETNFLYLKSFF